MKTVKKILACIVTVSLLGGPYVNMDKVSSPVYASSVEKNMAMQGSQDHRRDFFAYYTKEDHATDTYMGDYSDLIISTGSDQSIAFTRENAYLPELRTSQGRWLFQDLYPNKEKDDNLHYTYARVVESSSEKILVHWRYYLNIPDQGADNQLDMGGFTNVVHELFTIYPDGNIDRQVKNASGTKYQDWIQSQIVTKQAIKYSASGIEHGAVDWGQEAPIYPRPATDGNTIKHIDTAEVPLYAWSFDEGIKDHDDMVTESSTGLESRVDGLMTLYKKGVSGTALAFDGYSTSIEMDYGDEAALENEIAIEAWVAPDAYPWNTAPVLHRSVVVQEDEDDEDEIQEQGYYLGVEPTGEVLFKINDIEVVSESKLALGQWSHLVGTYDGKDMTLYINGVLEAQDDYDEMIICPETDLQIGLNNMKTSNAFSVRGDDFGNLPFYYGFQGLIDEVKVYDSGLGPEAVQSHYNQLLPDFLESDLSQANLPGERVEASGKSFTAQATTLDHSEIWDQMWRDSGYGDLRLTFESSPGQVIFWRGTNRAPSYVSDMNRWMADQSCESAGDTSLYEHMSDKQNRFGYWKVIEDTPARKRVLWRYGTPEVDYVLGVQDGPGRDAFAEEVFTIYPDGRTIRKVHWFGDYDEEGAVIGFQDFQVLTNPGESALDVVDHQAMTISNLDGQVRRPSWENGVPEEEIQGADIALINFKDSKHKVFSVLTGDTLNIWGGEEQSPFTEDNFAGPWNHWPISFTPSDGRFATNANDRVTHFALGYNEGSNRNGARMLYGFTDQKIENLSQEAKAWKQAPSIGSVEGLLSHGFDQDQAAFMFTKTEEKDDTFLKVEVQASDQSPLVNPCFVIDGWDGSSQGLQISMKGQNLIENEDYFLGTSRNQDGGRVLIISFMTRQNQDVTFTINKAEKENKEEKKNKEGTSDFKAYYTKLSSGESWENYQRVGPHADIMVSFGLDEKFYFWRASSYLPRWETSLGSTYVDEAPFDFKGDGQGLRWDKLNRHSHVRLIQSDDEKALIHWRYAPEFNTEHMDHAPSMENEKFELTPNWEGWVDEYYLIKKDKTISRQVYDYDDSIKYTYEYVLKDGGQIDQVQSNQEAFERSEPEYNGENVLPAGPNSGFGASYTKLGYSGNYFQNLAPSANWNDNWQVGDHPDIVVNFDDTDSKWVFWRGTNYVAHMVSEKGIWYTNEFNETWDLPGMVSFGAEPMNDKANRYAHAKIIENTPARVVVQMRYALCDEAYNLVTAEPDPDGWTDFSDFYYYIYPDGIVTQHNTLWSTLAAEEADEYEWQESIVVHGPGQTPTDNIESEDTVTLGNLQGDFTSIDWSDLGEDIPEPFEDVPSNLSLQRINLTGSDEDPFFIVESGQDTKLWATAVYDGDNYDMPFDWWNHWPVNMHHSFGELALNPSQPSHTSLTGMYMWPIYDQGKNYASKIILTGLTDMTNQDLLLLGQSWEHAPQISGINGMKQYSYNKAQRAYEIYSSSEPLTFTVEGSDQNPVYNPVFMLKDWKGQEDPSIWLDGEKLDPNQGYRQGLVVDTDGSDTLIIWLDQVSTNKISVRIGD